MKSIQTIFVWDKATNSVTNKQARGCEWVFFGKGIATRKWDGLAIKIENGKYFRRHELRVGESIPDGFVRVESPDPKKPLKPIPGWVPVNDRFKTKPRGSDERALKEAYDDKLKQLTQALWARIDAQEEAKRRAGKSLEVKNLYCPEKEKYPLVREIPDGTYELCGPKIHGNHELLKGHVLYKHGECVVKHVPRTFDKLKAFLETFDGEGIVFHNNPVGGGTQMAKIKRRDFGFLTRIPKEDLEMAYRKSADAPMEKYDPPFATEYREDGAAEIEKAQIVSLTKALAEVKVDPFAALFEPDNKDTGNDVHLEKENENGV